MFITEMRPGVPCWFELSSTDPEKSFAFYHGLFGWNRNDMDLGAMGTYSFLLNANGCVGAFCGMQEEQKAQGMPSCWGVYFAVEDCDAATARAATLGGTVIMPPFDVSEHGRMSVVSDPTGGTFCLWQPKGGGGNFVMFEDYSIGWVELATRDTKKAREFYTALLGWTYTESPIPIPNSGNYTEISAGGTRYGGILPMSAEWGDIPPHWGIYVMVPDVDRCCAKAKELGGGNPVPPFDAPGVGRIAMVADPTGAHCYIITLNAPIN
jgi:predicted enzyme related to lactoylglutathione lyase